jgi:pimeloyl-ACP methyl ester carboxylesterase
MAELLHSGARLDRRDVEIPPHGLRGTLCIPANAHSLIVFVHGSGSSRLSPRNAAVATALNQHGDATLLFDLLLPEEEFDRANVFDIELLSQRLIGVLRWTGKAPKLGPLPLGLFGASTGAAAALVAAASESGRVRAVVSRGGRPDLAGPTLERVQAATLLIVGGADHGVIELNQVALHRLKRTKALQIVPGATHLFEEPGALQLVTDYAARWFEAHL